MDERIKKIADNYGLFSQMWQTAEECSELIQALNKYQRVKGARPWVVYR